MSHSTNNYYNSWRGRELVDNVDCTGTESKLIDCSHNVVNRISTYMYSPTVHCHYGEHKLKITETKCNNMHSYHIIHVNYKDLR